LYLFVLLKASIKGDSCIAVHQVKTLSQMTTQMKTISDDNLSR
jgi:hypothetical protein